MNSTKETWIHTGKVLYGKRDSNIPPCLDLVCPTINSESEHHWVSHNYSSEHALENSLLKDCELDWKLQALALSNDVILVPKEKVANEHEENIHRQSFPKQESLYVAEINRILKSEDFCFLWMFLHQFLCC